MGRPGRTHSVTLVDARRHAGVYTYTLAWAAAEHSAVILTYPGTVVPRAERCSGGGGEGW